MHATVGALRSLHGNNRLDNVIPFQSSDAALGRRLEDAEPGSLIRVDSTRSTTDGQAA